MANGFIGSPEFSSTYGALNNSQFVELMYTNVLHRPSDAGRQTWLDLLNNGGTRGRRGDRLLAEPRERQQPQRRIHKGIWVGDLNAGIAARFYDTVFSRLPDAGGPRHLDQGAERAAPR